MPTVTRKVRNRQSPGGVIDCTRCDTIVSRRRFNNALRFGQPPGCHQCGSTDLRITGPYEIRGRRLVWSRVKLTTKRAQGRNV